VLCTRILKMKFRVVTRLMEKEAEGGQKRRRKQVQVLKSRVQYVCRKLLVDCRASRHWLSTRQDTPFFYVPLSPPVHQSWLRSRMSIEYYRYCRLDRSSMRPKFHVELRRLPLYHDKIVRMDRPLRNMAQHVATGCATMVCPCHR
jgi:hypothetical protein